MGVSQPGPAQPPVPSLVLRTPSPAHFPRSLQLLSLSNDSLTGSLPTEWRSLRELVVSATKPVTAVWLL